jgi:dihydroxy-acid dehydratase
MLDVEARRIELLIDDQELESRLAAWKASPPQRNLPTRGYARLFEDCVLQADQGCDFDFLQRESAPQETGS